MYKLSLSKTNILGNSTNERVDGIFQLRSSGSSDVTLCIRQGLELLGYKYKIDEGTWLNVWRKKIFNIPADYPLKNYPWFADNDFYGNDLILLRHPEGVQFYQLNENKSGLKLVTEDTNFVWHTVMFGRIYPDADWMGMMACNRKREIRFYAATKDSLLPDESDPLFPVKMKSHLSSVWHSNETEFFFTKFRKQIPEVIALRSSSGLEFYEFAADYQLKKIFHTSRIAKPNESNNSDRIFFANLTNQKFQDILQLTESGLIVHQYDRNQRDYRALNMHSQFSREQGWLPSYSDSIKLFDINSDGNEDLLFTGSDGLTALTFDPFALAWKTLLNPRQIDATQRFSKVVGTLSAVPRAISEPSVFLQDLKGKLHWAEINKLDLPTKRPPESVTTTSLMKIVPTTSKFQTAAVTNVVIPDETPRRVLIDKPILRWTEQWETNFLKNAADTASGQVHFSVPLVDTFPISWLGVRLLLSYNSRAISAELLGVGWSIALAQDYISVDYKGSIYPEDADFYLVKQGRKHLLKTLNKVNNIRRFRLAESPAGQVILEYHTSKELWIWEQGTEKSIYGKASLSSAKDALQWSLTWPNWRGTGQDKSQLKPLVVGWFLNARLHKDNEKLYYRYETDFASISEGKTYTSAIRLKSISDDEQTRLTFEYAAKIATEFKIPKTTDDQGDLMLPVPLTQKHYLHKVSVTTVSYQQTFQFVYEISKGQRLLSSIRQQFLSTQTEQMLQFKYQNFQEKPMLTSCTLSSLSTVEFNYETVSLPKTKGYDMLKYKVRERPKISYGLDYTVMAYSTLDQAPDMVEVVIVLKVMNREMTQIFIEGSINSVLSDESEVVDYKLETYDDSFVVFVRGQEHQTLHLFDRFDQSWSTEPVSLSFDKRAMIRFNDKLLIVAKQSERTFLLYKRLDYQTGWKLDAELSLTKQLTRIALHNELVIGYDDETLWRFYVDHQGKWQKSVLARNLGHSLQALNRFVLNNDFRERAVTAINDFSLHLFNNLILFSSIQEKDDKLSSNIQILLLDAEYNVKHTQTFEVERERILSMQFDLKQEGSGYRLHYVREGGIPVYETRSQTYRGHTINVPVVVGATGGNFRVEIESISGEIVKETINELPFRFRHNKNQIKDAIKKKIIEINKDQTYVEFFKNQLLIKFPLYAAQISQRGVVWSDDILIRSTGIGWQRENVDSHMKISLGNHFVLEIIGKKQENIKLFAKGRQDQLVKTLPVHTQFINRYPAYLAYQTKESVEILTFKDEKTLGQTHKFDNEQLIAESDWQNLITIRNASSTVMVHTEPYDCVVRPLSSLSITEPLIFATQIKQTDGDIHRLTKFERSFNSDILNSIYSETVVVIPGGDKSLSGWLEERSFYHVTSGELTKTNNYFDASGAVVQGPDNSQDQYPNRIHNGRSKRMIQNEEEAIRTLLLDQSEQLVISDFSPYKLEDEMHAYYGFESYENNGIGRRAESSPGKTWRFDKTQVIKGRFAFTGENFLQLKSGTNVKSSFIEGELQPRNQQTVYIASCWIRCNALLTSVTPAINFRAIISTTGGPEIIGFLAQVKRQVGDWFYLEVTVDFQVIRQIYWRFAGGNPALPSPADATFKITLRIDAASGQALDLDHIRFAPIDFDFRATVFQPLTGKPTSVVQANGSVARVFYNRLHQEIASANEEGQLEFLSSESRTGRLAPKPQGAQAASKPNRLHFKPEIGFYENFDAFALRNRWELENSKAWRIAPGQLWHESSERHRLVAKSYLLDATSATIRFWYALQGPQSSLSLNLKRISFALTRQSENSTALKLPNSQIISPLPLADELIVMLEQNSLWIWLNGVLLVDQELPIAGSTDSLARWSSFAFEVQGKVLVEDLFLLNRPAVQVEYFNAFSEKTQVVQLVDVKTAQVTETLYDILGRASIITKPCRVLRRPGKQLLSYRPDFVTNRSPSRHDSAWHTGQLKGEIEHLNPKDQGFAYQRTMFAPNPLNEISVIGLPGRDFSVNGRYAIKRSRFSEFAFLKNLFPVKQGYRQEVERAPNGSFRIDVFDKSNNRIAHYVRVLGFNHLLSTYEYDSNNRLVKVVPPLYHEKVDTASKLTPWEAGESHLTAEEKQWQLALVTRFSYDNNGNLVRKTTPDSGTVEYLYDYSNLMRFMVFLGSNNVPVRIVYYEYYWNGQLSRTGHLTQLFTVATLKQKLQSPNFHMQSQKLPIQNYQIFQYTASNLDPTARGHTKHCVTYNQADAVAEELHFNSQQQLIYKIAISALGQYQTDKLPDATKVYASGRLHTLAYPLAVNGKQLRIVHHYNKIGDLIRLATPDNESLVSFTYDTNGKLASEHYQPHDQHSFTRSYRYNSPSFLEQISDPFLTEDISYTNTGYGQRGYDGGMIMQTVFRAIWSANADGRRFQIHENALAGNYSVTCIKALKRAGYLTNDGQPVKLYVRSTETNLPLVCSGATGQEIARLVAEKQMPLYYGHRYAYGNHQELVKAKYFTDETDSLIKPLQPNSFAEEIPGINSQQSKEIWTLLTKAGYVSSDQQQTDPATAIGKRAKSFFPDKEMRDALAEINVNFTLFVKPIERLISIAIIEQRAISLNDFKAAFLRWQNVDLTSLRLKYNKETGDAEQIGQMLIAKGYLSSPINITKVLDKNFTRVLSGYTHVLPQIVRILYLRFAHALGETAFDVESYEIDANGNQRRFYVGSNRYELIYRGNTNQIQSINLGFPSASRSQQTFSVQHDTQGNVVQALHKGIQLIEYHPVSQRTTRINLVDGRSLRFYYDAQGERILKQVLTATGQISHETHYLRDEQGRVLADRSIQHLPASLRRKEISTGYIYGPRGMLGFMRNDKFYSLFTDHAGSIRLVVHAGEVVAAYDYLPYGDLMRSFGNDSNSHIVYRFTGQEWDEETGLYNYHARLYDPSIGRFYQPDPKSQYFSPYKYAGNSPVSLVDPDGEFAEWIIIGIIVGAYLGGADANNRWDPAEWDWEDPGTYFGLITGGVIGGFAPFGFAATAATIGPFFTTALAIGGAYVSTATVNGNFDPKKWEWDRPYTWNAMFHGAIDGGANFGSKALNVISIVEGIEEAYWMAAEVNGELNPTKWSSQKSTYRALIVGFEEGSGLISRALRSRKGRKLLVATTFAVAAYNAGRDVSIKGDWSSMRTFDSLLLKDFSKPSGTESIDGFLTRMTAFDMQTLKSVVGNRNHPLNKVIEKGLMGHFLGVGGSNAVDLARVSLSVFSTYEGILNTVFLSKESSTLLNGYKSNNVQLPTLFDLSNMSNRFMESWRSLQTSCENTTTNEEEGAYSFTLAKWQSEAGQSLQRIREIFPDRKRELLSCQNDNREFVGGSNESCILDFESKFGSTVHPKLQTDNRQKRSVDQLPFSAENEAEQPAVSSSERPKFWPVDLVKNVRESISSYLSSWLPNPPENAYKLHQHHLAQQQSYENSRNSANTIDMEKYLFNNTDVTGNLTWAVLIARKWSGYRPKAFTSSDDFSKETLLDIQADILMNEFMDFIQTHALACGIVSPVRRILSGRNASQSATKAVRRALTARNLDGIVQLLCKQFFEPLVDQIAFASTQKQTNKLLTRINKDLPRLQQQISLREQEWFICGSGVMKSSQPLVNPMNLNVASSQVFVGTDCPRSSVATNKASLIN